jgi:hypothetical protein
VSHYLTALPKPELVVLDPSGSGGGTSERSKLGTYIFKAVPPRVRSFTADDGRPAVSRIETTYVDAGKNLLCVEKLFLSPHPDRPIPGSQDEEDDGGEIREREWTSRADPPELDEAARASLMAYLASVLPGWKGLGDAVDQVVEREVRAMWEGRGKGWPKGWEKALASGKKTHAELHVQGNKTKALRGQGAGDVVDGLEALERQCMASMGSMGHSLWLAEREEAEDAAAVKRAETSVKLSLCAEGLEGTTGWGEGQDEAGRKLEAAVIHRKAMQKVLEAARRADASEEADKEKVEEVFGRVSSVDERIKAKWDAQRAAERDEGLADAELMGGLYCVERWATAMSCVYAWAAKGEGRLPENLAGIGQILRHTTAGRGDVERALGKWADVVLRLPSAKEDGVGDNKATAADYSRALGSVKEWALWLVQGRGVKEGALEEGAHGSESSGGMIENEFGDGWVDAESLVELMRNAGLQESSQDVSDVKRMLKAVSDAQEVSI